jgi:hypothetical protein
MERERMSAVKRMRALAAAALVMGAGGAAFAETDAQLATFERMQKAPVDHENTFAYVRACVDNRDFEGAIAALERILLYNPNLARAEYELGVLYFRLRSYEQAVIHFENALASPTLERALANRIDGYLPEARKQLERSRFFGVFQMGVRYNSNVAGVPGSDIIRAYGFDAHSLRTYSNAGDGSGFGLGAVKHIYDFQTPRGDVWESNFSGYGALQFKYDTLNVGLVDFSTGPRLALAPDLLPGWTIRPYAAAGGSFIFDRRYSSSYGGGVSVGAPITPFFSIEPGFEIRRIEVASFTSPFSPLGTFANQSPLATGVMWRANVAGVWSVSEALTFTGNVFGGRNAADVGGTSSSHIGVEAALKVEFAPPSEEIGFNWSVTPFLRYTHYDFARPDPTIDPLTVRRDGQFRTGAQVDMPITANLGVSFAAQYDLYDSNIRNYRATSGSFLIGPTLRF